MQPCHLLAAMVEEEEESSPWGNALSWAVNTYAEDPEAAARQVGVTRSVMGPLSGCDT